MSPQPKQNNPLYTPLTSRVCVYNIIMHVCGKKKKHVGVCFTVFGELSKKKTKPVPKISRSPQRTGAIIIL